MKRLLVLCGFAAMAALHSLAAAQSAYPAKPVCRFPFKLSVLISHVVTALSPRRPFLKAPNGSTRSRDA